LHRSDEITHSIVLHFPQSNARSNLSEMVGFDTSSALLSSSTSKTLCNADCIRFVSSGAIKLKTRLKALGLNLARFSSAEVAAFCTSCVLCSASQHIDKTGNTKDRLEIARISERVTAKRETFTWVVMVNDIDHRGYKTWNFDWIGRRVALCDNDGGD